MDFTNLDNEYFQAWQGIDQRPYINILIAASTYMAQLGEMLPFDDSILTPESLVNAMHNLTDNTVWSYTNTIDTSSYINLYNQFLYVFFLKYDQVISTHTLPQDSIIIEALKMTMGQFQKLGNAIVNTLDFLSNPIVLIGIVLLAGYIFINK